MKVKNVQIELILSDKHFDVMHVVNIIRCSEVIETTYPMVN